MLALLRKEAREALVGLLVLCPLLSWIAIHTGTRIVRPGSQDHLMLVAIFAVAIGVCHGIGEFAIEERNTWRYLVHRSTGYHGAFLAKLAVDWTVLALLTIIPLGVHAAWVVWFTDDASIALWSRYFEIATTAAIAVGAHAIGVFAAQLRRPTWMRFAIALAGSIGFLVASSFATLAPYDAMLGPAARYLLAIGAVSLLLYVVSYRMFVAGNDDDRAYSGRLGISVVICSLALLALSSAFIASALEGEALRRIVDSQPEIWLAGGKLHLVTQTEGLPPDVYEPGASKRFPTRVFARKTPASTIQLGAGQSPRTRTPELFEFGAAWEGSQRSSIPDSSNRSTYGDVWCPRRGGRIVIVQHDHDSPEHRLRLFGKSPLDAEFSPLTVWIGWSVKICFVDPQDGSLWSIDPNAPDPKLERIGLPANDAFVGFDRMVSTKPSYIGDRWQAFSGDWIVVGAHGQYQWNGEQFIAAELPENWVFISDFGAPPSEFGIDITRTDALEPTVVVSDAKTGVPMIEHAYTNSLDLRTSAAYACSIVRPTIGSVASIFRGAPADYRDVDAFFDPLLRNGRRVWLLALNVLLSAALAARAWRRGAIGDSRRVLETLAILLLGVPGALVLALVEPRRRAARKVIVATAPREQLLISSV